MKITDFIDNNQKAEQVTVQGFISMGLREKVIEQMSKDRRNGIKITWNTFLEAACLAYLNERKQK